MELGAAEVGAEVAAEYARVFKRSRLSSNPPLLNLEVELFQDAILLRVVVKK